MKIKCLSFTSYKLDLSSYVFIKMDLFEFLFTQIILNKNIDENKLFIEVLNDLDIKEDLHYLFNNVYYKLLDNNVIESNKEDLYSLKLKDLKINDIFIDYLKQKKLPVKKGKITKEYIYDCLNNKLVIKKDEYNSSNIACFSFDNSLVNLQKITNDYQKALFNDNEGLYLVNDAVIDPYYFEIELEKVEGKLVYKRSNKEFVYQNLINNSLFINNKELNGEYLANNIYFDYVFANTDKIITNSKYVFMFNKDKEGLVKDNIIYVNFDKFTNCDFVDLKEKSKYTCGVNLLENNKKISTYKKEKDNSVSEFKLYLIKNKNKFKININKIIEEI